MGSKSFQIEKFTTTDESIEAVKKSLVSSGLLKKGDIYVTTASMPMADIQLANSLKLGVVE